MPLTASADPYRGRRGRPWEPIMSTYVEVLVPARPATPRLVSWLDQAIEAAAAFRRAHAARAAHRRLAREAHDLRQLARELEASQPGMAADLRRAADSAF